MKSPAVFFPVKTTFELGLSARFGNCERASALADAVAQMPSVDPDSVVVGGQQSGTFPFWLLFSVYGGTLSENLQRDIRAAVATLGKGKP